MSIGINSKNYEPIKINAQTSAKTSARANVNPSFGNRNPDNDSKQLTPEQAAALAAQRGVRPKTRIPHITEKDINFTVTCVGYGAVRGNTRDIYDYRVSMQYQYGTDWYNNFKKPHIIRNGNLDEKYNGETTALVIPLRPDTPGIRGQDNMTMVLNGNIPGDVLSELVAYMDKVGILNKTELYNTRYYVNSTNPKQFMANPKIKTAIANFFRKKELEQANAAQETQKINEVKNDEKTDSIVKTSDINIVNLDYKQDKNNKRVINDYVRYFLKNNKQMTVLYDTFKENDTTKDMTVILIPSKKSEWDCLTVTIDNKKLSYDECKNLINHLAKNKMANVENDNFKTGIVDYLNKE